MLYRIFIALLTMANAPAKRAENAMDVERILIMCYQVSGMMIWVNVDTV